MQHTMRLHPAPIAKLRARTKTIEMRVNDEKRRLIQVDDTILFTSRANANDTLLTKVVGVHRFDTFSAMVQAFTPVQMGYEGEDLRKLVEEGDHGMHPFYPPEEEQQYGVVGIEVCVL